MIDTKFISEFLDLVEGNEYTAYVPQSKGVVIANSGVTIGRGVDLGQQDPFYFRNLGLDEAFITKISYYLGKTKAEAVNSLRTKNLVLSKAEVDNLNKLILQDYIKKIEKRWNSYKASTFASVSKQEQAVAVSLLYQYGVNSCPSTFSKLAKNRIQEAIQELLDPAAWGTKYYKNRREQEAALLREIR